jgi:YesN/AraC family two-component response regulator
MRIIEESKTIQSKHKVQSEQRDSLIIERLLDLMKDEKPYKNEDLNLTILSSFLFVTSHELSRILNVHFHQNFNVFINDYRIKEAKKFLEENPEMSILDVVYETGFRTKSSFYQNFVKKTGISPGQFKKNVPEL